MAYPMNNGPNDNLGEFTATLIGNHNPRQVIVENPDNDWQIGVPENPEQLPPERYRLRGERVPAVIENNVERNQVNGVEIAPGIRLTTIPINQQNQRSQVNGIEIAPGIRIIPTNPINQQNQRNQVNGIEIAPGIRIIQNPQNQPSQSGFRVIPMHPIHINPRVQINGVGIAPGTMHPIHINPHVQINGAGIAPGIMHPTNTLQSDLLQNVNLNQHGSNLRMVQQMQVNNQQQIQDMMNQMMNQMHGFPFNGRF